jgi:hypothetical protein
MLLTWIFPRFSMVVHPKTMGKFPPIPWIMLCVSPKTDGTDENKTCVFPPCFCLPCSAQLCLCSNCWPWIHWLHLSTFHSAIGKTWGLSISFHFEDILLLVIRKWHKMAGFMWCAQSPDTKLEILHFDPNHSEGDLSPIAAKKVLCFATFRPHIHVR